MLERANHSNLVLVVCHANICRSPLIAFLLDRDLGSHDWRIESRGTHTRPGMSMCARSGEAIKDHPAGREFIARFASRRLERADVGAGLILTASTRERSIVARLDPSARERTFTLSEATGLLASVPEATLADLSPRETARRLDAARRGGVQLQTKRAAVSDIPDPHTDADVRHAQTIALIARYCGEFAEAARPRLGRTTYSASEG